MLISNYLTIGIIACICIGAGVYLERWRLARRFQVLLEKKLVQGEWIDESLSDLIASMSILRGIKGHRDVLRILKLCEARCWKKALASLDKLPSTEHNRLLATLNLRLVVHLNEWSRLESAIESVLQTHGSTRLVFGALVAGQQWTRALSLYDGRLRRQGSQREREWLRWLSTQYTALQNWETTPESAGQVMASFAEVMDSQLPDDRLLADMRSALKAGARCLEEAAALIDFQKKVRCCESEKERLHLIRETRVRSDWLGLRTEINRQVGSSTETAMAQPYSDIGGWAVATRAYRCVECDWVSLFSWVCPRCNRVGPGMPTRDHPQSTLMFGLYEPLSDATRVLEPLYWCILLEQNGRIRNNLPIQGVVLEAT